MEEERDFLEVACDLGLATDFLKYLCASGILTEDDTKTFSDIKGACIDFLTAYEYYID